MPWPQHHTLRALGAAGQRQRHRCSVRRVQLHPARRSGRCVRRCIDHHRHSNHVIHVQRIAATSLVNPPPGAEIQHCPIHRVHRVWATHHRPHRQPVQHAIRRDVRDRLLDQQVGRRARSGQQQVAKLHVAAQWQYPTVIPVGSCQAIGHADVRAQDRGILESNQQLAIRAFAQTVEPRLGNLSTDRLADLERRIGQAQHATVPTVPAQRSLHVGIGCVRLGRHRQTHGTGARSHDQFRHHHRRRGPARPRPRRRIRRRQHRQHHQPGHDPRFRNVLAHRMHRAQDGQRQPHRNQSQPGARPSPPFAHGKPGSSQRLSPLRRQQGRGQDAQQEPARRHAEQIEPRNQPMCQREQRRGRSNRQNQRDDHCCSQQHRSHPSRPCRHA